MSCFTLCKIVVIVYTGSELIQLFQDAPTTELPLSMLSASDKGRLTVVDLAVKTGAAASQCRNSLLIKT